VLQGIAGCCRVMQVIGTFLQSVAVCCSVLQCVAVCCRVLLGVAGCCRVLQCIAVRRSVLQCAAVSTSVPNTHMQMIRVRVSQTQRVGDIGMIGHAYNRAGVL